MVFLGYFFVDVYCQRVNESMDGVHSIVFKNQNCFGVIAAAGLWSSVANFLLVIVFFFFTSCHIGFIGCLFAIFVDFGSGFEEVGASGSVSCLSIDT